MDKRIYVVPRYFYWRWRASVN